MNLSYTLRLVAASLAIFFVLNLVCGVAVRLALPWLLARAQRVNARAGARMLFWSRLAPAAFSTVFVGGVITPAYLLLEPNHFAERVSGACIALALLALCVILAAAGRATAAAVKSAKFSARCRRSAKLADARLPEDLLVVEGDAPMLALVGVLRPRVVISAGLLARLSPAELDSVLAHERAHFASHENLKRFLLRLAPEILPGAGLLREAETAWARLAEWSADDSASAGDEQRSLSLATALLRVARMGSVPAPCALSTTLVSPGQNLSQRVERLLGGPRPAADEVARLRSAAGVFGLIAMLLLLLAASQPSTFQSAHDFLEFFIR